MALTKPTADNVGEKLDLIARLLAYLVAAEHDTVGDRAVVLRALGLQQAEIARICMTTPKTVGVRLAEAKKKATGSKPRAARRTRKGQA